VPSLVACTNQPTSSLAMPYASELTTPSAKTSLMSGFV
jgi:hypothetical protein